MSTPMESRAIRNCRLFSPAAGAAAIVVGALVLVGWWLHVPAFTGIFFGLATMKPNTALCFISAGLSLWLIRLRPGELTSPRIRYDRAAQVLGIVVGLAGLLTLVEYLFDVNLGIDEVLFQQTLQASATAHPGRMAGATALGFLLLGGSVLLITIGRNYLAQSMALTTSLNGFVACIGYLLRVRALYDVPAYSSMALHTAVLFTVIGLAAFVARPRFGLMTAVTSDYVGGARARRVLPLAVVIPTSIAWLRWHGQLAGLYAPEFGIALRTLVEVVVFTALLLTSAIWLNQVDEERLSARRHRNHLAAIVESSDDAILSKDLSGTIVSWNQGAEQLYGYKATEIVGKPVATIIPPELQEDATQFLKEVAEGRLVTREETVRRRKDGSPVHVSLIVSPVRGPEGHIVGASAIAHDISERKRAEQALRESAEQFRTLANAIPQLCWMANADGWIHWYNERWYQYTGTTIAQMRGWGWQSVHDPVELPTVMQRWQASIATGEPFDMVFPLRGADGVFRPFLTRVMPVKDTEGRLLQWFGTNTDISEQKIIEDALRQSEARLREYARLVEGLEEMIVVVDRNYRYAIANRAFLKYRGLEKEELIGRHVAEVLNKEAFEKIIKAKLDEAFRGKIVRFEMKYTYPGLGERDLLVSYFPIEVEGRIDSVASILQDATAHKQAEAALRESEDQYRDLVESSHDLICTHDLNGKLLSVNSAAAKALECESSELLKTPMREIIVPAFREQFDQYLVRMKERGWDKGLMAVLTRTGERRIWQYDNTLRTEGVSLPIVRGMARDVTERVVAEKQLRESEGRLRLLVESANVGLWDWNLITNDVYFSPQWKSQIGYAEDEISNRFEEWQSRVHPDDLDGALQKIHAFLANPQGRHEVEFRFRHKDGSYRWIYTQADVLRDAAGKPVRMLGCHLDVTERKKSEEALRQSLERLQRVLEVETVGVMFWDLNTGYMVDANQAFLKLMGYSRSDVEERRLTWQKLTPPEYIEVSRAEVRKFLMTGRVGPYEKEYFRKDGTRQWLLFAGSSLGDNQCVEFCVDISERKRAEEELRAAEKRFSTIFEKAAYATMIIRLPEGVIADVNPAWTALFGYSKEEAIGKTGLDLKVFSDAETRMRLNADFDQKGSLRDREICVQTKSGESRVLSGN